MLVSEKGEFELIAALADAITARSRGQVDSLAEKGFRLRLSIGDDAAAWDTMSGATVFTTDTMVEGVHFDLQHIGWKDLGWKSMAINLSDVAAMGCLPTFSTVTLGLRGDLPVDGLVAMYHGMQDACGRYGGAIVGGDVVRSPVFFVTVAMQGAQPVGAEECSVNLLTRDAASPGDLIAVTGHLGCSAGGLRMVTQGLRFGETTMRHLKDAHNRPEPRVDQGSALVRAGATAAIDVSDGLLADLGKLAKASGVDALIQSYLLPVDEVLKKTYPDDWLELALGGGEDYELLFTAPSDVMDPATTGPDVPLTVIGQVVEGTGQVTVLNPDGKPLEADRSGWDHFPPRHEGKLR